MSTQDGEIHCSIRGILCDFHKNCFMRAMHDNEIFATFVAVELLCLSILMLNTFEGACQQTLIFTKDGPVDVFDSTSNLMLIFVSGSISSIRH